LGGRRYEQFKHEISVVFMCGIGQVLEALGLTSVKRLVVFRIVSYQCLNKIRLKFFNFGPVAVSIFELKFRLAALFSGHTREISVRMRIPKKSCAELRVDKNAGMFLRNTFGH